MDTAELDVGALLAGRYRLTRLLGAGGMSRVFLAQDELLGRDVAVKLFASSMIGDDDDARRRDEVRLLASLAHPGLVVLFDAALEAQPPFLTMEYVAGETLGDRLARGPLDAVEAAEIIGAVSDALAVVHAGGVVHRDVKPANILLPAAPALTRVKLADFGIARLLESDRVTAAGTVIGTAAYLSPEQASGRPAGPASDVYSLGVVLIESLTGRRPFPGTGLESAAARLSRDPDLEAAELAPYRSLLQRMTARDPGTRPSAAEVAMDLRGGAATRTMAAPDEQTAPLEPVPVRRPRVRVWALGVAAAGLIVVAAVGGFLAVTALPAFAPDPPVSKVMPSEITVEEPVSQDPQPASGNNGNGNEKGPKDDKGPKHDKGPKNGKG